MKELFLPCVYAFVACFAFCFVVNIRGRMLLSAPLGASLGWLVYIAAVPVASELLCYFFATLAVSVYAEIMARFHRAPATGFLLVGLLPLVPGGGIYYTMEYCISGDTAMFLETGLHTFGIAGSLALGVLFVSSIVRFYSVVRRHLRRKEGAPPA